MNVSAIDHIVLTVLDVDATCRFYSRVLGMSVQQVGKERRTLHFGDQKINLHQLGREWTPHAAQPTSGAADLCLLTTTPISEVIHHLQACGVELVAGPVQRTGARGTMVSVYLRDPDQNLIEIARYA